MASDPLKIPIGGAIVAALIGALDGLAASGDTLAGRSWNSPGMGTAGGAVLAWGWAPLVQLSAIGLGAGGVLQGLPTELALYAGTALLSRAGTLQLAQHGRPTPARVQG